MKKLEERERGSQVVLDRSLLTICLPGVVVICRGLLLIVRLPLFRNVRVGVDDDECKVVGTSLTVGDE